MITSILPKTNETTILGREDAQDNKFRSSIGRIEETINCFRDLKAFKKLRNEKGQIFSR